MDRERGLDSDSEDSVVIGQDEWTAREVMSAKGVGASVPLSITPPCCLADLHRTAPAPDSDFPKAARRSRERRSANWGSTVQDPDSKLTRRAVPSQGFKRSVERLRSVDRVF